MDPPAKTPVSLAWLALLGAVVGVFSLHVGRVWEFTADDAAVAFSYARNVAGGHGYVLTPGAERVEAPEGFLWVLLLALAGPLHVGHEVLAKALGLAFGAGSLVAVAFFPAAAYGRRPRAFDLVAPAVAASFAHLALWSASGLETGLYAFLAALSLVAFAWEERDPARAPWSSLALAALFAARPDGAVPLAALLAVKLARAAREGPRRQDVFWALGVAVGVGALELFRVAYFAAALPNGARTGARAGLSHVAAWARAYRVAPLLAVAPAALLSARAWPARAALALAVAAGFAVPLYRRGEGVEEWRDLAPVAPLLCLLVGEALRVGVRAAVGFTPPARRRVAAVALSVLAAWGFARQATRAYGARFAAVRAHTTPTLGPARRRARYFAAAARALGLRDVTVLDPAIGGLSYGAGLHVVDPRGVGDAAVARTRGRDPRGLLEVIFFERRPALVRADDAALPPSPALDRLYLPLPARIGNEQAPGDHRVRRELLAAPWAELADAVADVAPGGPDRVTLAADALSPGDALTVTLSFADVAHTPDDGAVVAVADDGAEVRAPAAPAGGVIAGSAFAPGERPVARVRLRLRAGHHRIEWRGGGRSVALGEVRVAAGAGAVASAEARARLDGLLARDRVREARGIALRLLARAEDVPGDVDAREALAHLARALAARAGRLGDAGSFAEAADLARESRRFAASDPEATAAVARLVESMADASRRAERDGDARAAFSLARDAVLLDPRRSWLRRRAETWRRSASHYDVARDASAYESACGALAGGDLDAALAALGDVARWREAAALAERVGRAPSSARAALAAARGHVGRGEFAEARALADGHACEAAADAGLARALRTAGWRGACQAGR